MTKLALGVPGLEFVVAVADCVLCKCLKRNFSSLMFPADEMSQLFFFVFFIF
jgi:hypothetical protein